MINKTKNTTQKFVLASMLAALVCVATMIIKIPTPLKGYVNLGDSVVLLAGWMLTPVYGFFAAAIGSALADLLSGYVMYAPATFVIKGVMAVVAYFVYKALRKKSNGLLSRSVSGVVAEIPMVAGYYVFEGFLYGFIPSAVNIIPNVFQAVAGIVFGIILIKIFEKSNIVQK